MKTHTSFKTTALSVTIVLLMAGCQNIANTPEQTKISEAAMSKIQFNSSQACSSLPAYDKNYASYGDYYGQDKYLDDPERKVGFVHGFYQLANAQNKVYAAFGGAFEWKKRGQNIAGTTPGQLVILNADTMQLEKAVPLPFHAHAISLNPAKNQIVLTHTHQLAFSFVDLKTGQVTCMQPDSKLAEVAYRGRYVQADNDGNIYVNYYSMDKEPQQSLIMKYDSHGEHSTGFIPQPIEEGMALPLFISKDYPGQVLVGSKGLKSVNSKTGAVTKINPDIAGAKFYNYSQGPGKTIVASQNASFADNLYLIDPDNGKHSSIYTMGNRSVELKYNPTSEQLFSTNFDSKTLSVVALAANASAFDNNDFVNIKLNGEPSGLAVRDTAKATEVFVVPKWGKKNNKFVDIIVKISIAKTVKGISGIHTPGACTITEFDMATKQVSAPRACEILDKKQSAALNIKQAKQALAESQQQFKQTQQELISATKKLTQTKQQASGKQAIAKDEEKVKDLQKILDNAPKWIKDAQDNLSKAKQFLRKILVQH